MASLAWLRTTFSSYARIRDVKMGVFSFAESMSLWNECTCSPSTAISDVGRRNSWFRQLFSRGPVMLQSRASRTHVTPWNGWLCLGLLYDRSTTCDVAALLQRRCMQKFLLSFCTSLLWLRHFLFSASSSSLLSSAQGVRVLQHVCAAFFSWFTGSRS